MYIIEVETVMLNPFGSCKFNLCLLGIPFAMNYSPSGRLCITIILVFWQGAVLNYMWAYIILNFMSTRIWRRARTFVKCFISFPANTTIKLREIKIITRIIWCHRSKICCLRWTYSHVSVKSTSLPLRILPLVSISAWSWIYWGQKRQ